MLPLLVLLGTIAGAWYLLIVRPQKDLQTRHGQLVERLQAGDHVLTVGGIYGLVVAIEQSSVVLELAPGLTTRIATDGIARIVHGAEAASTRHPDHVKHGGAAAPTTPRQATEDDMHEHPQQHPHPEQAAIGQQFAPAALPRQPFAPYPVPAGLQAPVAAPAPAAHPHAMPARHGIAPAPPAAPAAPATTTLRAQVLPVIPTFEPRPWGDVAPQSVAGPPQPAPHAQHPPIQHQPVQAIPASAPYPLQQVQAAPHLHYGQAGHAPQHQPMPLHVPFSPAMQQAPAPPMPLPVHAYAQQPVAYPVNVHEGVGVPAMQPAGHPGHAPMPTLVPAHAVGQAAPQHQPVEQPAPPAPEGRKVSRAPKGMGSSLRLDDPSLRDTISRARGEREGLADEYRRLTAPLVQVEEPPVDPSRRPAPPSAPPHLAGHDASGVPLFAAAGTPTVQPLEQYPGPARLTAAADSSGGVPRPVLQAPTGQVDPALQASAFQRRTPYAPRASGAGDATQELAPALAHAHA